MRRINDALGRFYSTLVYVILSVTLGKDHHIHIRIYACAHGHAGEWRLLALERRRRLARRESATEYFRLVLREKAFAAVLYKQPLMNKIVVI